ncbi:QacE family quaternary ammonium compound efflux SMR transporter [Virgibacillus phasianinus]|uniref:QacE family quaternary ammonium compound efflux SMR transporter n=1 Tax=Virgibacillus phasianinus TaxID=2017483 RepID=A0A220U4E9_9BACI|nr:multidrug efflux SMR transporter [Virgibacillus phasianinus]ASK62796.1 QacE family quaternary ammonium compound efflux SMR transporter [Virgibacillus phasianinus]
MKKEWNTVFLAGLFEIGWVVGLKHAESTLGWIGTVICIYVSMHLLIIASKNLPVGTTYAVFTGIGTAGTVLLDIVLFNEPFNVTKILLIALLLGGVIGLKTITTGTKEAEH